MKAPAASRAWPPLLLGVAGGIVPALLPRLLGMVGPGGSDPGLWVIAVENLRVGAAPTTAPLYPGIAAGLAAVTGSSAAGAAYALTVVAFALLPPLTWLLARRLGAGPTWAAAAGLLAVVLPSTLAFSVQIQADAVAAAVLLAVGLSGLRFARRPGWASIAALALAAAAASLAREHVVPLTGLLVLGALLPEGRPWERLLRAGIVVGAIWATPLLLGQDPGLPWQQSWFADRMGEAAQHATAGGLPPHIEVLPPPVRAPFVEAYASGDQVLITLLHARHTLVKCWQAWLLVAIGLVACARLAPRPRLVVLVVLAGLAPCLVAWSQPRHIAVFLPLAAAVWGAGASRARRAWRIGLVVAAVAGAVLAQGEWTSVAKRQRDQAASRAELVRFGTELCARLEPGAVVMAGDARRAAYCPLPRVLGVMGTPYDWKLVWLGELPRQHPAWDSLEVAGWSTLELDSELTPVYRLRPWLEGGQRPCADSEPTGAWSYSRFRDMAELPLEPPCDTPSPVRGLPPMGKGPPRGR